MLLNSKSPTSDRIKKATRHATSGFRDNPELIVIRQNEG